VMASALAAPAVPEAVNVTGLPMSPALAAVKVFAPANAPSVQLPTVAMPLALVVCAPPARLPPPVATANVTLTPLTGLLFASLTSTLGGVATAVPLVAVWPLPALIAICVAAPAAPVAVKVRGDPVTPIAVAVRVSAPATAPIVQLPTVAIPDALVVALSPVADPPPVATANVTATPPSGLLLASLTITLGGVATAVPTVAV